VVGILAEEEAVMSVRLRSCWEDAGQGGVRIKQTRKRYKLMIVGLLAFDLFGVLSGTISTTYAAEGQPAQSEATPSGEKGSSCCKTGDTTPPTELVKQVPKGQLHSPYPDYTQLAKDDPDLVKQFRLPGCNECHGGTGGGGICPALTQGVWFWGNTDDVLFRLVTLGSVDLEKEGYKRLTYGTVHAPMPPMGGTIKTSDQLWKIIAFIRSINPPGSNPPDKVLPKE
jgi:mono/diheme cytochrome c family protein